MATFGALTALSALAFLAAVLAVTSLAGAQTPPPTIGDWVISDVTTLSNTDVNIIGNVTVRSGGTLVLTNVNLDIDSSADGAYNILVESGGTVTFTGVTVDSTDGSTFYNLTIHGTATLGGCTLMRLDGPQVPNPLDAPRGLAITSGSVRVHNTTIYNCRGFAVTARPGGLSSIRPVIEDCTIIGNGGGVFCAGLLVVKANAVIRGCTFFGNSLGDLVAIASDPRIVDCTFGRSALQSSMMGVTAALEARPLIEGCTFTWNYLSAITSLAASPVVVDCSVSRSGSGLNVLGGSPQVSGLSISNTVIPVVLNWTNAKVTDCSITGFVTPVHAVTIDAGRPEITRLSVDLSIMGGGVSIINGSDAIIRDSTLAGTGLLDSVSVVDSGPTLVNCTVRDGADGMELLRSEATVRDCHILGNSGWGILAAHAAPTMSGNSFGTGADANGEGRVLQLWTLTVRVEDEHGARVAGANVTTRDSLGAEVANVTTDGGGLAFSQVLPEYEVNNQGGRVGYSPYRFHAWLGELANRTTEPLDGETELVLVLREPVDLPPTVTIAFPADGGTYNAWDHPGGLGLNGSAVDPEDGPLDPSWALDGTGLEDGLRITPLPGEHTVELWASDSRGQEARATATFIIVSEPPTSNGVEIVLPPSTGATGTRYGSTIELECTYSLDAHPYHDDPFEVDITWTSDRDGRLATGAFGNASALSVGHHVITVTLVPPFPEWIPRPYTDSGDVDVWPPLPVAHANISSPDDGAEFRWDAVVRLSAEGSYVDVWDPPEHTVLYLWSSDIAGPISEGMELDLDLSDVPPGVYAIRLQVTTDPFLASANATVSIIVHPDPNQPPVARITLLTNEPRAGEPVNLSARGSSDPDGDLITYRWDLGDGNASTSVDVNHTYGRDGNYTVVLTVSDSMLETTVTMVVRVLPAKADGGNGGDGGDGGDGDDDARVGGSWLGWLILVLLLAAVLAMLWFFLKDRSREG